MEQQRSVAGGIDTLGKLGELIVAAAKKRVANQALTGDSLSLSLNVNVKFTKGPLAEERPTPCCICFQEAGGPTICYGDCC
jgi:hypothetical protein